MSIEIRQLRPIIFSVDWQELHGFFNFSFMGWVKASLAMGQAHGYCIWQPLSLPAIFGEFT